MGTQGNRRQVTAKGARSRAAILAAASTQFADNGYRGASLASIAAAANLTQQGVLHYFRSKEDLLLALIEERDREDGIRLSALVTEEGLALLDVLDSLVKRNVEQREEVRLFMTLVGESTADTHPARDYFTERYQRIRNRVLRSLRHGQVAGEIRPEVDLAALVPIVVAVMDGLQLQWLLDETIDMAGSFEAFASLLRGQLAVEGIDLPT